MGNRAVVTFEPNPTKNSVGVYLHWQGGPESIRAFADVLDELKVSAGDDYELARFAQIVGNYFGGVHSIGVGVIGKLDCENYDNGVYVIDRTAKPRVIKQSPSGNLSGPWQPVGDEVLKHEYFKKDKDGKNIVDNIREAQHDSFDE